MNVTTTLRWFAALGLALAAGSVPAHNPPRTDLQRPESFLREVFGEQVPESETIWMAGDVVPRVRAILGHKPLQLRIPYWRRGGRTAWVLEESMEGAPVTAGVVIGGHADRASKDSGVWRPAWAGRDDTGVSESVQGGLAQRPAPDPGSRDSR